MIINEIFKSIQGESSFAGKLCTFVRLTGCNLRCSWCDTTYSFDDGEELTTAEIKAKIRDLNCNLVEFTGGEPLVQKDELLPLIFELISEGYQILLETNGSISLAGLDKRIHIIMDIKLPSSGMFDKMNFENLKDLKKSDELKFVIDDLTDYTTFLKLLKEHNLANICNVLLSKTQSDKLSHRQLADLIVKDNLPVRYQVQLHKIIWQDERGK